MRISRTIRSGMNEKISLLALFVTLEESEIDRLATRLYPFVDLNRLYLPCLSYLPLDSVTDSVTDLVYCTYIMYI